jgi:hypothetical protein
VEETGASQSRCKKKKKKTMERRVDRRISTTTPRNMEWDDHIQDPGRLETLRVLDGHHFLHLLALDPFGSCNSRNE